MKRTRILTACLAAASLLSTGCGVSDSIKSLTLTASAAAQGGTFNLNGVDGTLQLVVIANYHSGKNVIVTNDSTFAVAPVCCDQSGAQLPAYGPTTVPINPTGLMTAVNPICTWADALTGSPAKPANPPVWVLLGYYQVTASYRNFTSQPIGVGVGAATSINSPTGGCGPA